MHAGGAEPVVPALARRVGDQRQARDVGRRRGSRRCPACAARRPGTGFRPSSGCAVRPGQWPGPWRMPRSGPPSSKRVSAISVSKVRRMRGCCAAKSRQARHQPGVGQRVQGGDAHAVRRRRGRRAGCAATPSMSASALPAASASWRPSAVSDTPRAWRWNRATPSRASSLRTWWLTALAVRCSSSAAWAKFWWRAADSNAARAGSQVRAQGHGEPQI